MPNIEETKLWVCDLHEGQTDKAEQPYIGHILRVHENLLRLFPDVTDDSQHAALLHDTIEDCGIAADDADIPRTWFVWSKQSSKTMTAS